MKSDVNVKVKISCDAKDLVKACKEAAKAFDDLAIQAKKLNPKKWWQFWK